MQSSIVLCVKACLAARKAAHCAEKACNTTGMLWYGYTIRLILRGMKIELVEPFL